MANRTKLWSAFLVVFKRRFRIRKKDLTRPSHPSIFVNALEKERKLLRGPLAQLGERLHGMEEVIGSIPTRSTIFYFLRRSVI